MLNYSELLVELNEQQRLAVCETNGPVRIIAGPGAGKTRTLTYKIAYIILMKKVDPSRILALTFTNHAANEMRERLKKILNKEIASQINIYTYHALCNYILRVDGNNIEIPKNYIIHDIRDQKETIDFIQMENGIEIVSNEKLRNNKKTIINLLSKIKSEETTFKQISKDYKSEKAILTIINSYLKRQKELAFLDFDDLILNALQLFRARNDIAFKWSSKYDYLVVDEFQDTNNQQYEFLKFLTLTTNNISIVGDDDQTIYTFRGSKPSLFNKFAVDYNAKTVVLNVNYRSTINIINTSNKLIEANTSRYDKQIVAYSKSEGEKVKYYIAESTDAEAIWVVNKIRELLENNKNLKYKNIVILYRNSTLSRSLESTLLYRNIPFKTIGSYRFYDYAVVKETLSYLSFLANESDLSFIRIINVPRRAVGNTKMARIFDYANTHNVSYVTALIENNKIKKSQEVYNFLDLYREISGKFDEIVYNNTRSKFVELFYDFLEKAKFLDLYRQNEDNFERINQAIEAIDNWIKSDVETQSIIDSINNFLAFASLDSETSSQNVDDAIRLMTFHAAKGQEFNTVFLFGLIDRIIPDEREVNHNLEEERRVLYVAMTRAKKNLFLTANTGKSWMNKINIPSRFLNQIKDLPCVESLNNDIIYNANINSSTYKPIDNSQISKGDKVSHTIFGEGIVVEDKDRFIKIAFTKEIGVKQVLKNHPTISKIPKSISKTSKSVDETINVQN